MVVLPTVTVQRMLKQVVPLWPDAQDELYCTEDELAAPRLLGIVYAEGQAL